MNIKYLTCSTDPYVELVTSYKDAQMNRITHIFLQNAQKTSRNAICEQIWLERIR